MPLRTITRWAHAGPWQSVLPGVVAGHRGPVAQGQLRRAALAYAGAGAALSGLHALDLLGITGDRIAVDDQVLVLIPWTQKRLSSGFVTIERSQREPRVLHRRGLPVVDPARAAADAARHGADLDRVREIFGATLHQRRCSLAHLRDEVFNGPTQRSATARRVLTEVSAGVRSSAEGKARELIVGSGLPQPLWNEAVVIAGELIGEADAYWPRHRVALEIDGVRWHSTPADLRRTQAKQRRYSAAGVLLLSIAPADFLEDPGAFLRQLASTLETAERSMR